MGKFDWLAGLYDHAEFTAFDTETTGLDPETNRVVEIGAVRFDSRGVIARYNALINPEMPMPEAATAVNNITDEMLADKPIMADVLPDFLRFSRNSILIAHNAKFDLDHLNAELARLNKTGLTHTVIDTIAFARDVFPGLPSYALQNLAKQFAIPALQAHRAEDDARVCMDFFNTALERFLARDTELVERMKNNINPDDYVLTKDPKTTDESFVQDLF